MIWLTWTVRRLCTITFFNQNNENVEIFFVRIVSYILWKSCYNHKRFFFVLWFFIGIFVKFFCYYQISLSFFLCLLVVSFLFLFIFCLFSDIIFFTLHFLEMFLMKLFLLKKVLIVSFILSYVLYIYLVCISCIYILTALHYFCLKKLIEVYFNRSNTFLLYFYDRYDINLSEKVSAEVRFIQTEQMCYKIS